METVTLNVTRPTETVPNSDRPVDSLTKRELFAMAAMQGMLSAMDGRGYGGNEHYEGVAKYSLKYADALLKELNNNDNV